MLDLALRNARLPDGTLADIGIARDRIAEIGPGLPPAARDIDAGRNLVSPPFVDSHFHLDSALSAGHPRANQSGTLLEGIAIWAEAKPTLREIGRAHV